MKRLSNSTDSHNVELESGHNAKVPRINNGTSPVYSTQQSNASCMDVDQEMSDAATILQMQAELSSIVAEVEEYTVKNLMHNVTCNLIKRPGHIYHLFRRPSGEKYLGLLSPQELHHEFNEYLGSFLFNEDQSWTQVTQPPSSLMLNGDLGIDFNSNSFWG